MRIAVIPSEARNPSSIKIPRKERFIARKACDAKPSLTSQTPFGMTNAGFFSKLLERRSEVQEGFLHSGTAKGAVPPVGMTYCEW